MCVCNIYGKINLTEALEIAKNSNEPVGLDQPVMWLEVVILFLQGLTGWTCHLVGDWSRSLIFVLGISKILLFSKWRISPVNLKQVFWKSGDRILSWVKRSLSLFVSEQLINIVKRKLTAFCELEQPAYGTSALAEMWSYLNSV